MRFKIHSILLGLLLILMMGSCNVERHIGLNEHVLYRNQYNIEITDSTVVKKDVDVALNKVKSYAIQKPNKRILGVRLKMRMYCLSNPNKNNWINRFLRKEGEEPITVDVGATQRTTEQIKTLLASKGCFNSQVNIETKVRNRYDMTVKYNIIPSKRYKIDEVNYKSETAEVIPLLNKWSNESYLKVGDCYDQEMLSKERDRLAELLKNSGYYWANKELITYTVDTTYASGILSIDVMVNNPRFATGVRPLQKYNIGEVYIYPNSTAVTQSQAEQYDTLLWNYPLKNRMAHFKFLTQDKMKLRPNTISKALFIIDSTIYTPLKGKTTYNSLLNLKNFKYIGIDFIESPLSSDSSRLVDAHIRLQNNTRQKLSLSLEASNSTPFGRESDEVGNLFQSGNIGLETVLEYQNRNLFGGAELFKIDGSLLVELPKLTLWGENGKDFYKLFSSFEVGIDMSLDVPQFWLPFTKNIIWQRNRPHTMITLGANYQYRSYFERILTNASFGYNWQQSRSSQHKLIPIEIAFVRFLNLDSHFMDRLTGASDLRLKYMYSDHFVMDAHYTFSYSTQKYGTRKNFNYLNASFESAGNLLNGLSALTNGPIDTNGFRQIFKVPYAQYVKFTVDAKRYFYHGKKSTFVARLMAGVGIPYGNSLALPYEKSYYGGGPLTMRGWQLRRLGPGGYCPSKETIERMGDINLVINLEERFPLFSVFEGAAFADIGNIWLMHESTEYPNGEWKWNRVLKELAVGVGIGIRANISIMTLRLDFSIPLYDPGYTQDQRWRIPHWKFNQIVTNFGIDYPF